MAKPTYTREFYDLMKKGKVNNLDSASSIVKYILTLFPKITSVVDVGCGIGAWAYAFKTNGVKEVLGIDGFEITDGELLIEQNEFVRKELESPIILSKKYDLAVSTEVAEHLSISRADSFIKDLTKLSDIIVFSAAIKNQGGAHHVNEQRQSYWKKIFKKYGFEGFDLIRPQFANDKSIIYFYRQNMFIYIKNEIIKEYGFLDGLKDKKYVADYVLPEQALVKSSNTWNYICHCQYLVLRAAILKFFGR